MNIGPHPESISSTPLLVCLLLSLIIVLDLGSLAVVGLDRADILLLSRLPSLHLPEDIIPSNFSVITLLYPNGPIFVVIV